MWSFQLAYATALIQAAPSKFFGGVLVLDSSGDPLEFRCTTPVQPLPIQHVLWGQRLKRYILTELLLIPLVNSLQTSCDLILVEDADFLGARTKIHVPLLLVSQGGGREGGEDEDRSVMFADPLAPERKICLTCTRGFEDDLDSGRRLVEAFARACFPLEPFRRVEEALKLLKDRLERRA